MWLMRCNGSQLLIQAIEKFGKVHIVVNNAGVGGDSGPIENQETEGWQWALGVNLMGVVYGAKVMTPLIKDHGEGGWILNVSSMAGMGGVPYSGAYTASKAAVVALSESWAAELQDTTYWCICSMSCFCSNSHI